MTTDEKIWTYLKNQGLTDAGVAGLMGNLYAESGLSPINLQDTYEKKLGYTDATYTAAVDNGSYTNFAKDSAGYGLAQWTYHTRKAGLLAFAQSAGKSVGDLEVQLGFLMKELSESFKPVLNTLKTVTTVKEASDSFLLNFERPADQSETAKTKRTNYGLTYYYMYAGKASAQQTGGTNMSKCYASTVLAIAIGEIGYKEKASNSQLDDKTANAGSGNWTKYARDFDQKWPNWYNGKKNGFAWCDTFVDWAFLMAFGYENALRLLCQPEKSAGAGCIYSYGYYKAKGQVGKTPKVGAQIFFGKSESTLGHTGIVEKFDSTYVYTIEGNTSDQVARRTYSRTDANVFGYGYPAYDEENGSAVADNTASTTPSTTTPPTTTTAPTASTTEKKATASAKRFDGAIAGAYKVTANSGLHVRNDSKTTAQSLVVLPKGTVVQNYGYFNNEPDGKWLYVQVTYGGIKYTGFSSAQYLSK